MVRVSVVLIPGPEAEMQAQLVALRSQASSMMKEANESKVIETLGMPAVQQYISVLLM